MTNKNEDAPSLEDNGDILKNLKLNSCITFTVAKDGTGGTDSPAESSDYSSEEEEDLSIPSALRGINLGGAKGTSISTLLNKAKEGKDSPSTNLSNFSFLKGGVTIKGYNDAASSKLGKASLLPKGVSIQGVKSSEDSAESSSEDDERQLSSSTGKSFFKGFSISKVPAAKAKEKEASTFSPESNSSDADCPPSPELPSALQGIAIKGFAKDTLSNLLKQNKEKKEEVPSNFLSNFSKKGLSISFSKKDDRGSPSENGSCHKSNSKESSTKETEETSLKDQSKVDKQLTKQNSSSSTDISLLNCPNCKTPCTTREELLVHVRNCKVSRSTFKPVARKKTTIQNSSSYSQFAKKKSISQLFLARNNRQIKRSCVRCGIINFKSFLAFEEHHAAHIRDKHVGIKLYKCSSNTTINLENNSIVEGSVGLSATSSDKQGLKVVFKFTQKGGKGKKTKTVQIVNSQQEMSGASEANLVESEILSPVEHNLPPIAPSEDHQEAQHSAGHNLSPIVASQSDSSVAGSSGINNFPNFNNFESSDQAVNERPPSAYQPQFESFTGDWFTEYESGSRIAAAMTGSSGEEGSNQGGDNFLPPAAVSDSSEPSFNKEVASDEQGGLFSQSVLGGEAPHHPSSENNQGSFEQLCLNDAFGASQPPPTSSPASVEVNYQQQQFPSSQGTNDLLSEFAYLNNQPADPTRTSPLDQNFSPHSSNSGTPSSTGHPTPPPPIDTSFRSLAASPTSTAINSSGGPTPPLQHASTTPPNSASPLQQMSQMSQHDSPTPPRLTIANNLMATTTNSSLAPPSYDQQWSNSQASNLPSGTYGHTQSDATYGQASSNSFTAPLVNNGGIRNYAPLPAGYRPSPPPRVRGRPPLVMGMPVNTVRPGMVRGPGRPPVGSPMPQLLSGARLNSRGSYIRGGLMMGGLKRTLPNSINHSPNKVGRKEDINVPSRQKDNECQIIAVANRNEGMPIIANVQGSSNRSNPVAASDSTIHLSDSITMTVRSNGAKDSPTKGNKDGGDAGIVANLLASRGITVTPAEKEREEQRRLPTASDLNLSSAISVHPPTSRDRDGFAVPQPPSPAKSTSTVNNQLERPSRPPTVDLTTDVSPTGGTRIQCSQCSRTFPTQSLLADHAKVHQQQAQSRMSFKCHLCSAGFSNQKGQQNHYQQFHQLHLSAGDLAIPVVDFRNPANVQRMARLGITSFLPLSNLQNRGAGGVVGVPILTLENLRNGQVNLQQWGITDVLTLGPPKTLNTPRLRGGPVPPMRPPRP